MAGVTELISAEMRSRKIDLLVLDRLVTAAEAAGSAQDLKLFVSELQAYAALMGCTILLLNIMAAESSMMAEQTMVDGILTLRHELIGFRHERSLEVSKFRGSAVLDGAHTMRIDDDGIAFFPRLEVARTESVTDIENGPALSTGVPGLDNLSQAGGYPRASVTALAGPPGSGKTLLGLHFVTQATVQEPALLFGCYESPALLREIAGNFGIDLVGLCEQGVVEIIWQPYGADHLDELGYRLFDAIDKSRCKRVLIDGLGVFLSAPGFERRGIRFLATLSNGLRRRSTTTLVAVQSEDSQGFSVPMANHGMAAMADNVARLRIEEQNRKMHRLVSISKVRGSRIDLSLHELRLLDSGLQVAANSPDAASNSQG